MNRNYNKINTYLGRRKNTESWKLIKNLWQKKKGDVISQISMEKWENHFKHLLTDNRAKFKNEWNEDNIVNIIASPLRIKAKESECICREIKSGKATSSGEIPAELIKYGTDKLYNHFKRCQIPKGMENIMDIAHAQKR